MYVEIYKCKMCGEKIQKSYVNDIIADIALLKEKDMGRHFCQNGNIGIVEFIGYEKVEK